MRFHRFLVQFVIITVLGTAAILLLMPNAILGAFALAAIICCVRYLVPMQRRQA